MYYLDYICVVWAVTLKTFEPKHVLKILFIASSDFVLHTSVVHIKVFKTLPCGQLCCWQGCHVAYLFIQINIFLYIFNSFNGKCS
jgi:hypothetical protein